MNAISNVRVIGARKETDSLSVIEVPGDKLWGARTIRGSSRARPCAVYS
jgi:hypothetical protein